MYDHVGLNVRDHETSKRFYEAALAASATRRDGVPHACGYGPAGKPEFWIVQREPFGTGRTSRSRATTGRRSTRSTRQPGGWRDRQRPAGIREHYHEHYYGAFVLDPDGNNVEAVCHKPED